MATSYTTTDLVADQLRRDVRVEIGQAEPSDTNQIDLSFAGVDSIRIRVEGELSHNFGRFYSIPLRLTDRNTISLVEKLATELTAYNCWLAIHPQMTRDGLPAAVMEWKKNADALLAQIVPPGKSTAQRGRDIILEGESLLAGAGTAGTASVVLTRFAPFGGTE
jgi:hypothetical protein